MRRSIPLCLILATLFITALAAAEPSVGSNGWSNVPGTLEGTITARAVDVTVPQPPLGYLEYLPLGYDPSDALTAWPLVVFISGLGEVGDGTDTAANGYQLMTNMIRHGPFRQMVKSGWDFPAIVVAVQPPGAWNNATILQPVFDYLQARYRVDPQRMYLTGLSDGAPGTLNFASQHPGILAGIIPIAVGSGPNPGMAAAISSLPMWTVHSFNDDESARTSTILWVDQTIQATQAGAAEVMSTYPGYAGVPYHMAVDIDTGTGLPLDPFGPAMLVPASTLTNGSDWIQFPTTTFGSAMFNSWNGSDAQPYAHVVFGTPPARGAKAGLMFRDSTAANAMEVMVAQGANNEVFMQWRSSAGGTTSFGARSGGTTSVKWLRLVRSGSAFTGSYSVNGTDWVALGSPTVPFAGSAGLAGLAVTAHNDNTTYAQTFSSLEVGGAAAESLTDVDIGSPRLAGSATLVDGVWTVVGGGADIADSADQFNFAYQPVEGDQTLTVRVGENAPRLVVALGKADGVFLTQPYVGPTAVRDISIQLPIGYNTTAYFDAEAAAWAWQRNQNWDRSRPSGLIFTMTWYNNHSQAWIDTYANGDCWDWLFSQRLVRAPLITAQPQSLSRTIGTRATFTVTASASPPLTYQWKRGALVIAGATAADYSINAVTLADDGATFTATVGSSDGSVTSASALLTVTVAPVEIVPASPTATSGGGGCGAGTATGLALGLLLLGLHLGTKHSSTTNPVLATRPLRLLCVLLLLATVQSAEPSSGRNGWTNIPGVMEGTVATQAVDTTLPRSPLGFVVYLPKGYVPGNQTVVWPLVVFCTGIGEIGNGTDTVANGHQLYANMTKPGPLHQITAAQWDFPGIVIAAQSQSSWSNTTSLKLLMEYAKTNYRATPRATT